MPARDCALGSGEPRRTFRSRFEAIFHAMIESVTAAFGLEAVNQPLPLFATRFRDIRFAGAPDGKSTCPIGKKLAIPVHHCRLVRHRGEIGEFWRDTGESVDVSGRKHIADLVPHRAFTENPVPIFSHDAPLPISLAEGRYFPFVTGALLIYPLSTRPVEFIVALYHHE